MSKLALLGGEPALRFKLSSYNSMGEAEINAVNRVVQSGTLSGFYGSWSDEFWGGPEVKKFEMDWSKRFKVKHSISVNSATSGLYAAMGAVGIGPGDEVIVPPYTMSATVMAPLIYGGVPVFADIENETFGLDPEAVQKVITRKTKAIIVTNLFGHPARLNELKDIVKAHNLFLIEDNAQGPLAEDNGRLAGTIGHIGIFSLNFHKHIHTGEGGMCVTNDDDLALRMKLIRNHGENVTANLGLKNIANLFGFNFRMTELQAAIGIEQLKRMDEHVEQREVIAQALSKGVTELYGFTPPKVRTGCRHVYYVWAIRFDEEEVGVTREVFSKALLAEGFPHAQGYMEPLYMLPIFQRKIAVGSEGFPFNTSPEVNYKMGICPVCETLYQKEIILFEPCAYRVDNKTVDLLISAIHKVYKYRNELKAFEKIK